MTTIIADHQHTVTPALEYLNSDAPQKRLDKTAVKQRVEDGVYELYLHLPELADTDTSDMDIRVGIWLRTLSESDVVRVYLSGSIDPSYSTPQRWVGCFSTIINNILFCKAKTIGIVNQNFSMLQSLFFCACKSIEPSPYGSIVAAKAADSNDTTYGAIIDLFISELLILGTKIGLYGEEDPTLIYNNKIVTRTSAQIIADAKKSVDILTTE